MSTDISIIATPQTVSVRRVLATDSKDDVGAKLMALDRFAEWLKEARAEVEASAKEYIEEHGPVRVGDILYYVGRKKSQPKCVNVPAAVEAVLQAVGGDFDVFCQHLASGALKYGAVRQTLPAEQYAELFKVEERDELIGEDAAKVERRLQKADTRFLK